MYEGTLTSTRRRFLGRTAGLAVAAGLGLAVPARRVPARNRTLRVAQWTHFVPGYDEWFDRQFARAFGERHGVEVVIDHLAASDLRGRAATEAAARHGHDLFGFVDSPAGYEDHLVPLDDLVSECERRFGAPVAVAHRSTFGPRTRKYFALSDTWAPAPLHYRSDWWGDVGVLPDSWDRIREGARKIRERHGAHAGFGLAPEPDSNMVLRGLLWSYGAAEQDESGRITINSRETVEALKLMAAIYRESMTPEVFMWDPSSNNRFFIWGKGSIIQNAISAIRSAEKQNPDVAKRTALVEPAAGPKGRLTAPQLVHCYAIWKFADEVDLAKRFLLDLVAASEEAFRASEFYNLPAFSKAVPDLRKKLAADKANPGRYTLLADAERWSACPGHPGYASAAVDEVLHRHVIPRMFARVAHGEQSAEDSARQAEAEMKRIVAHSKR